MIGVEAFARKTPVLARDLGAMPELIEDSGGGFLYRTDEELLDAMRRIAGSPQLRAELGQKGYDAFLKYWSREAHLGSYFGHLNRIAGEKFGKAPWFEQAPA
jgi:glycosyltransferase involved in cell wall biosynthesis